MNMRVAALSVGLLSLIADAHGAALEDFSRCNELESAIERLDCFERTTRALEAESAPPPAPEEPAAPLIEDSVAPTTDAAVEPVVPAAPRAVDPPPAVLESESRREAAAPERREPEAQSGSFGKRKRLPDQASITSHVTKVAKSRVRRNIYRLTLANGQVWQETQYGKGSNYRVDDRVTIEASRFGTFVLTNHRTTFTAHVKRIN